MKPLHSSLLTHAPFLNQYPDHDRFKMLLTLRLDILLKYVWHAGNQFQITLRELKGATRTQVEAAAAALKEGGFINYYGLQRFGSGSVPTHK